MEFCNLFIFRYLNDQVRTGPAPTALLKERLPTLQFQCRWKS